MPEWLQSAVLPAQPIPSDVLAVRLGLALALGMVVALVYRASHGRESADSRTLTTTLVLLSVLIAMVSMVIGDSVARAFGLVGALSIVRFRTVVDDTRDTAFVIFAVIVGMAVGTGLTLVPVIGIPIVAAAAIGLSRWRGLDARVAPSGGRGSPYTLTVRVGIGQDPTRVLAPILAERAPGARMMAAATARQGAAVEVEYLVELRAEDSPAALVAAMNQVEGVQSVEVRRD